jgi:hypothetical protein
MTSISRSKRLDRVSILEAPSRLLTRSIIGRSV